LAQEELDSLHQQYDQEIENLKLKLSEANQKTEKQESLLAQLQEWQDYANNLKGQNEEMNNNFHEIKNQLQNLENENAQISQQQESAKIAKEEETPEESTAGNWKLLLSIIMAVVLGVIGFLVFGKETPTPVVAQQQNNNTLPPIGYPYLE
jgi:seryl-tRNA synthetase